MKTRLHISALVCVVALMHGALLAQTPAAAVPVPKAAKSANAPAQPSSEEQAFHNNCSRCHNAPEGFSPRIAGTVVKHMRVRANLSAEEERLIMSFFAP